MRLAILDRFQRHASAAPDRLALTQVEGAGGAGERRVTLGELAAWIRAASARFSATVPPGGVVIICSQNQPELTAAFLAALAAGLRAFPVSPELAEPELLDAAVRSKAAAIIGTTAAVASVRGHVRVEIAIDDIPSLPSADAFPDRSHDTAGLLLLSSGTTGRPKIVVRDARSLDAVSEAMAEAIGFTEQDHVLACVPLCHSYGIEHGLLAPTWAGSCVHLARGFDLRAAMRQMTTTHVSIFPGVPFMFEMLAEHAPHNACFPTLHRAYSAGGPLPRSVADSFGARFGVPATQLYGATEIGSITYSNPDLPGFDPASVGRAMKGVSIRILRTDSSDACDQPLPAGEHGHVAVAAASMLSGYLGDDGSPPPIIGGHFLTGDLGRLDEFGNLTITGRIKLLIDVGGLKVNPLEVEEVLAEHPDVAACVVVPVRVSETVSRLKAIVTARCESVVPDAQSLRAFARSRLARYKVPRLFEVRPSLPKSPTGKILRHLVQA